MRIIIFQGEEQKRIIEENKEVDKIEDNIEDENQGRIEAQDKIEDQGNKEGQGKIEVQDKKE